MNAQRRRRLISVLGLIIIGIVSTVVTMLYVRNPPFTYSYYSPGVGTVALMKGQPPGELRLCGKMLPCDLLVTCDVGGYLCMVGRDGRVKWQHWLKRHTRGASGYDGMVFYGQRDRIEVLDSVSGKWLHSFAVSATVNALDVRPGMLIACYNQAGPGSVEIFDLAADGASVRSRFRCQEPVQYPRAADLREGNLVIADTFGHRVIVVDVDTGGVELVKEAYYPADVQWLDDQQMLVAEEHANRISIMDRTGGYRLILSAPHLLFSEMTNSVEAMKAGEKSVGVALPGFKAPWSPAAERIAGFATVYSPNGAVYYQGRYIIADTDNHRLLVVEDGRVVSAIYGFNNPVKICPYESVL